MGKICISLGKCRGGHKVSGSETGESWQEEIRECVLVKETGEN